MRFKCIMWETDSSDEEFWVDLIRREEEPVYGPHLPPQVSRAPAQIFNPPSPPPIQIQLLPRLPNQQQPQQQQPQLQQQQPPQEAGQQQLRGEGARAAEAAQEQEVQEIEQEDEEESVMGIEDRPTGAAATGKTSSRDEEDEFLSPQNSPTPGPSHRRTGPPAVPPKSPLARQLQKDVQVQQWLVEAEVVRGAEKPVLDDTPTRRQAAMDVVEQMRVEADRQRALEEAEQTALRAEARLTRRKAKESKEPVNEDLWLNDPEAILKRK